MREHNLIIQLKNDDRHAFDSLYGMYARKLMSVCLQYIKIVEDAEEIIQDIFVSLWQNRHNIQNTQSLWPFLFGALHNKILYYFRKKLNSPIYEEFINIKEESHSHTQRDDMEFEDFRKIIFAEINALPKAQRDSIIMSKFRGMSNKEISEELNLSLQTIKNALSLGLKSLKIRLEKYPDIFPLTTIIICTTNITI